MGPPPPRGTKSVCGPRAPGRGRAGAGRAAGRGRGAGRSRGGGLGRGRKTEKMRVANGEGGAEEEVEDEEHGTSEAESRSQSPAAADDESPANRQQASKKTPKGKRRLQTELSTTASGSAKRSKQREPEAEKNPWGEQYEEFLKVMTHKILNGDPKYEILKAFPLFDDDETGKIPFKNLKRVAKELGERMTDEELQEMTYEADRDGDGEVNEEEFLQIMKKTILF